MIDGYYQILKIPDIENIEYPTNTSVDRPPEVLDTPNLYLIDFWMQLEYWTNKKICDRWMWKGYFVFFF